MPDHPTEKCRFKSAFGGGYVSAQQFLAESMCRRKAAKDGKELPQRFWELLVWNREFALQARHAAGLLKLYSYDAIVRALRSTKGKNIFSLGAPFLDPLVQAEQLKLDREAKSGPAQQPPAPSGPTQARPAFEKKTTKSKLKDL
jgi:hypothetical protein